MEAGIAAALTLLRQVVMANAHAPGQWPIGGGHVLNELHGIALVVQPVLWHGIPVHGLSSLLNGDR
ncbi:MAG: hypothetical protein Q7T90_01900 [Thiobacillus sp.]|nr:hypothetical protein [Thiobacillus sp.]